MTANTPTQPSESAVSALPAFPRISGETPRAFAAFAAFFHLGPERSHQAVADQLGENPATVKNWSSRYRWHDRLHAHASGLLEQQARAEVAAARELAADWARRTRELREQEWLASQKLLAAAQCFLDSFGDAELQRMNLSQVSRAVQIASGLARHSLSAPPPPEAVDALSSVQVELVTALKKVFAPAGPSAALAAPVPSSDGAPAVPSSEPAVAHPAPQL